MKQGLTYQLTERKGAADGHSAAVPLSVAFNHIDIMELNKIAARWPARAVAQFYFIDN